MKKISILISVIFSLLMLCSCGKQQEQNETASLSSGETVQTDISTDNMDFELTNNDLKYDYDEGSAIVISEDEDISILNRAALTSPHKMTV